MTKAYSTYDDPKLREVQHFAEGLTATAITPAGTFDSVAANDFITEAQSRGRTKVPEKLQVLFEDMDSKGQALVLDAITTGMQQYEVETGQEAPADIIHQAIHSAWSVSSEARKRNHGNLVLDSATSLHSDNLSLQPNRAVVAIMSIFAEPIPWVMYLPADIGSRKAILAIMQHQAGGTAYGQYAASEIMDGVNSGKPYTTSSRIHKCAIDGSGNCTGKLTTIQTDDETCDSSAAGVKLLRGRSVVYVNGIPSAFEVDQTGSGNSTVSGSATIGSTTYAIAGTINTDTGVIALTTSTAIPNTANVVVEGFIDYERDASITPYLVSAVNTFNYYAKPFRVLTSLTIDSGHEMRNELGLDPYSEAIMAIQQQQANERHFEALAKARRIAIDNPNTGSFDFNWAGQQQQKIRAQIILDLSSVLGTVSQQMAEDTYNHGVTHLYVGKFMAGMMRGLPAELFVPSGIVARPGIYRVGTLFGAYEVYYNPRIVEPLVSGHQSSTITCVGRATDVTRNPIVIGDAVAPQMVSLNNTMPDMNQNMGFYACGFSSVNRHKPSALGIAQITVTNIT